MVLSLLNPCPRPLRAVSHPRRLHHTIFVLGMLPVVRFRSLVDGAEKRVYPHLELFVFSAHAPVITRELLRHASGVRLPPLHSEVALRRSRLDAMLPAERRP